MTLALVLVLAAAQESSPVARGSTIFAAKCGIGYCHGAQGGAGRGPKLADRSWDQKYLVTVISDGVKNGLMPAFKDQLSAEEIRSVVAYIVALGTGVDVPVPTAPAPVAASEPGRAIFFDAANPRRCAACHRFQGKGSEAGPDLTARATSSAGVSVPSEKTVWQCS